MARFLQPMTEEPNAIRIVIADGQPVIRQGLRRLLECDPAFRVLGEASDAYETAELAGRIKPDVLLADLDLSRVLKLETLSDVATSSPTRILATVATVQRADIIDAFLLGAHGIVLKAPVPGVLIQSIRSVMAGQYWLENASLGILVKVLREVLSHGNGASTPKEYGLTRRELDIIAKIVSGRSNKEVGADFSISERTVKHHLTNIFCKVGVTSRLQLALFAVTHHLNNPATSLALRTMQSDEEA
jgi:two-component system, NarL family, nitrate/nitrite response regulator NarL